MEVNLLTNEEIAIIDSCQSYPYQNKNRVSALIVGIVSVVLLLVSVIFVLIMAMQGAEISTVMLLGMIPIILMFAYIIKRMQFDTMKILTQYFRDEYGFYYKIQFTKISTQIVKVERQYSLIPLVGEIKTVIDSYHKLKEKDILLNDAFDSAQSKIMAYYYVKRYKQGIKDWDFMNGGAAKVIPLGNVKYISGTKYESVIDGKRKIIRVPAVYGKIAE